MAPTEWAGGSCLVRFRRDRSGHSCCRAVIRFTATTGPVCPDAGRSLAHPGRPRSRLTHVNAASCETAGAAGREICSARRRGREGRFGRIGPVDFAARRCLTFQRAKRPSAGRFRAACGMLLRAARACSPAAKGASLVHCRGRSKTASPFVASTERGLNPWRLSDLQCNNLQAIQVHGAGCRQ